MPLWMDNKDATHVSREHRDLWIESVLADLKKRKFDVRYTFSGDSLVIAVRHENGEAHIWDCKVRRHMALPEE